MSEMNTGDVSRRLGVPVTAELLKELGFESVGNNKRAVLWDPAEYPAMCEAVAKYIRGRASVPMQPKPEPKKKEAPATSGKGKPADDDDEL